MQLDFNQKYNRMLNSNPQEREIIIKRILNNIFLYNKISYENTLKSINILNNIDFISFFSDILTYNKYNTYDKFINYFLKELNEICIILDDLKELVFNNQAKRFNKYFKIENL